MKVSRFAFLIGVLLLGVAFSTGPGCSSPNQNARSQTSPAVYAGDCEGQRSCGSPSRYCEKKKRSMSCCLFGCGIGGWAAAIALFVLLMIALAHHHWSFHLLLTGITVPCLLAPPPVPYGPAPPPLPNNYAPPPIPNIYVPPPHAQPPSGPPPQYLPPMPKNWPPPPPYQPPTHESPPPPSNNKPPPCDENKPPPVPKYDYASPPPPAGHY